MIGSAISAARSCYSPAHYYYAAHEKDGIGLWFLFGVACIALGAFYCYGFYTVGENFPDLFMASAKERFAEAGFALAVASYPVLIFFLITLLSLISMMLMLLNVAVIYAMLGVGIGIAMNATLDYMAVLRIAVYAQVASYIAIIALGVLLHQAGMDASWVQYAFIPLMLGYLTFGIYSAK
jgi:hypothetical protein